MSMTLHPSMTLRQVAEWCAQHRCEVQVSYLHRADGSVIPLFLPRLEQTPARQART